MSIQALTESANGKYELIDSIFRFLSRSTAQESIHLRGGEENPNYSGSGASEETSTQSTTDFVEKISNVMFIFIEFYLLFLYKFSYRNRNTQTVC